MVKLFKSLKSTRNVNSRSQVSSEKILWKSWQKAKNGCNQNIKVKSIDDEIVATVNGVCISETVALEVNNRSL